MEILESGTPIGAMCFYGFETPMHLLILDNAVFREIYKPKEHWARFLPEGLRVTCVRKDRTPPGPRGFSHALITGSEGSILEPSAWVDDQCDWIGRARDEGLPVLGSCHGHQMIAAALAGKEAVRKSETPEFGWVEIELLEASPLFEGAELPVIAFCSHFDEVHRLPEGFTVLARSDRCSIQAFRAGDAPVFGVQAHPEIGIEEGRRLREDFAPRFPEMLEHPLLGPPRDSGVCSTIVRNFLAIR